MADNEGWVEAGKVEEVEVIAINPMDDPQYVKTVTQLRQWHGELLSLNVSENPALIGDYLGKMRLNCNLLFSFLNAYINLLVDAQVNLAVKGQNIYEQTLKIPKKSENAAKIAREEKTRIDSANVKVIENRIQQIKNEYERYNGICMYLQSRLKEFNTERIMG